MATIASVASRVINDSRGQPTVEVTVTDDLGNMATASLPNGASIGKYEAHIVDAQLAVTTINTVLAPKLLRFPLNAQEEIDRQLDEFNSRSVKEKMGVNTTLGISLAAARLMALSQNVPLYHYIYTISHSPGYSLPTPMFNLINGGKHATNNLDFQEYMVIPFGIKTFWEKMTAGKKIFQALSALLKEKQLDTHSGDEGGFAPNLSTNEEGMTFLVQAIQNAGYEPGKDVMLGSDIAASSLSPKYKASPESYMTLFKDFPLLSLEDPFKEDEWDAWLTLKRLMDQITDATHPHMLVGDDIFVGNKQKLTEGIQKLGANAVLIKMNQSSTLTQILECIELARKYNYVHIISHRSGETLDTFISDLAIGTAAAFIKAGAPNEQAPHRIVKYDRIVQVEEELTSASRGTNV